MQNSGEEHRKVIGIFVGYIKVNQKHEFIMNKTRELSTVSYCDSGYGDLKGTMKINMVEVQTI